MESSDKNESANIDYVPIRILMWSLLNEEDRKTFNNATNSHPSELVTVSKFVDKFWNDPLALKTSQKGTLHAELAWYGIRTIIKGMYSKINPEGTTEYTEEVAPEHFSQLMGGERQIPRKWTNDVFTDQELRDLIKLYPLYEKWRQNNGYYDELDIARVAIRTLRKSKRKEINTKDKIVENLDQWTVDERVGFLPFGQERFIFKRRAYNKLREFVSESNQRKYVLRWMNQWSDNFPPSAKRVGISKNGIIVYKSRLSKSWRIIFTPIKNTDKSNIEQIVIYDIAYNHDDQDDCIEHALEVELGIEDERNETEIDVESFNTTPTQTPGRGPLKSLNMPQGGESDIATVDIWDVLNKTSNIYPDQNQLRTIVGNNPILINGMAGSGKTAVLALRGAIRAAFPPKDIAIRILYTCYNPSVLTRLQSDTDDYIDHDMADIKAVAQSTRKRKDNLVSPGDNDAKSWKHNELRYHEILIDEAQDLTRLELEILKSLTVDGDIRRIQMAGDPLQTLNPSGFNWKQIEVMISEFGGKKQTDIILQLSELV